MNLVDNFNIYIDKGNIKLHSGQLKKVSHMVDYICKGDDYQSKNAWYKYSNHIILEEHDFGFECDLFLTIVLNTNIYNKSKPETNLNENRLKQSSIYSIAFS